MIVYRFGLESPENRSVLEKISSTYPQKPIFVEATQAQSEEFRDLLSDHEVVVGPVTVEALVGAVDSLRGKSRRTGASAP